MLKKLLYISPRDMRKNRSDAVHIMHSCSAFSNIGIEVDLLTPSVKRSSYMVKRDVIFDLYDLNPSFNIIELPTKFKEDEPKKSANWKFGIQKLKHHFLYAIKNLSKINKYEIVYSKCFISSVPILIFKKLGLVKTIFVFEAPFLKNSKLHNFIVNNSDYIVVGSTFLEERLKQDKRIKNKVVKTPRRYYFGKKDKQWAKKELRLKYGFNEDMSYVLYAGKTGLESKEVSYLTSAAKKLPQYMFVIVGVTDDAREHLESYQLPNLKLFPFQKIEDYENIIRAADVLVGYYADNEYNRYYLGPGKTSSYFKSKNPVIYSDLPALRDRYTDDMVYFLKPDDTKLLADKIEFVVKNTELSKEKTEAAYKHIVENSFEKSKTKILEEIEQREKEK